MLRKMLCGLAAILALTTFGAFKYETTLTVGGYTADDTLADFPLLVRISPTRISGFQYSMCQADGKDIAFALEDGTACPHEIDEWNTDGESLVWVKVPLAKSMKLVMKFGDSSLATSTANPTAVWSDYTGVWHMNETENIGTTSFVVNDVSGHSEYMNLTAKGKILSEMTSTSARVGRGVHIQERSEWSKCNALVGAKGYNDLALGDSFTVSGWFYLDKTGNSQPLFQRNTYRNSKDGGWSIETADSGGVRTWDMNGEIRSYSGSQMGGNWRYMNFVFNGTSVGVYIDGALKTTWIMTAPATDHANNYPFVVGGDKDASRLGYYGTIDEVRLSDGCKNGAVIAAEYTNMATADYITFSAVEERAAANTLSVKADESYAGFTFNPAIGESQLTAGDVTCTATADEVEIATGTKAHISGWTLTHIAPNGGKTTTNGEGASCTFTHETGGSASIVWHFARTHQVSVTSSDTTRGTVSGSGWYAEGATATVTASVKEGYYFSGWTGDVAAGDEKKTTLSLTMDAPKTLLATFVDKPTLTVTAASADTSKGTVTGGGQVVMGDETSIIATAKAGYRFAGWTGTGVPSGFENSYRLDFEVSENVDVVATFTAAPTTVYTFTPKTLGANNAYHWSCADNWDANGIPPNDGAADVIVNAGSAFNFAFDGSQKIYSLRFKGAGKMTAVNNGGWNVCIGGGGLIVDDGAARPKFAQLSGPFLTASQKWRITGSDLDVYAISVPANVTVEITGGTSVSIGMDNFKGRLITDISVRAPLPGAGLTFANKAIDEDVGHIAGTRTIAFDQNNGNWNKGATHGGTYSMPLKFDMSGEDSLNFAMNAYNYSVTNLYRLTGKVSGTLPTSTTPFFNFFFSGNTCYMQYPNISRIIFEGDGTGLTGGNEISICGTAVELANSKAAFTGKNIRSYALGGAMSFRLPQPNWNLKRGDLSALYIGDGVSLGGEIHLNPYIGYDDGRVPLDGQIGMFAAGCATFAGDVVATNRSVHKVGTGCGELTFYASANSTVKLTGDFKGFATYPARFLGGGSFELSGDNAAMTLGPVVQAGAVILKSDTAAGNGQISVGADCAEVLDVRAFAPMENGQAFGNATQVKATFGGVALASGDKVLTGRDNGYYTYGGGTTRTVISTPVPGTRARIAEGEVFGGKSVYLPRSTVGSTTKWMLESEKSEPDAALLAANGVTIANDIVVADNKSEGSRTLGVADASTVTFSGNVILSNSVTFAAAAGGVAKFTGSMTDAEGTKQAVTLKGLGTVELPALEWSGRALDLSGITKEALDATGASRVVLVKGSGIGKATLTKPENISPWTITARANSVVATKGGFIMIVQ